MVLCVNVSDAAALDDAADPVEAHSARSTSGSITPWSRLPSYIALFCRDTLTAAWRFHPLTAAPDRMRFLLRFEHLVLMGPFSAPVHVVGDQSRSRPR